MADNVTVTPGSGTAIAADDIAGVFHQRVKVQHGADGSATDVSSASPLPVIAPAMLELGVTELVGINEQVDQSEYGAHVGVALGGTYSGELLSFAFFATEDGTGEILESTGQLLIFDADPTISAGDTSITNAERLTLIGVVDVAADDWIQADANGATAVVLTKPIPFHAVSTLYFAWFHTLATSINSDAGDDEQLEFNAWYRRDS